MTARTGKPVRVVGGHEVQRPAPGTLLVVCRDCGFTWDADHTTTGHGEDRYDCPLCDLQRARLVVDALLESSASRALPMAMTLLLRQVVDGGPGTRF